jgi:chromate reductase, NAD(P)H dehydrogenase (quinone)
MSKTIRILGIAGSLQHESYNGSVLRAVAQFAPEEATIDVFEIDGIPLLSENDLPAEVVELKRQIREADAVLFVMPEYNYSIPEALQNVIDWTSPPSDDNAWSGKPAAVMSESIGGFGAVRAHCHLRQVMDSLDMIPLNQPEVMIGAAGEHFDTVEKLTDDETKEYVARVIQSLVDWTRRIDNTRRRVA